MPFSPPQTPHKELYEQEGSDLSELNLVIEQLNSVEIAHDSENETTSSDDRELYEFNKNYLTELNLIRRRLNLAEIPDENVQLTNDIHEDETKTQIDDEKSRITFSNQEELRKYEEMFNNRADAGQYTPPKKKKRLKESSSGVSSSSSFPEKTQSKDEQNSQSCRSEPKIAEKCKRRKSKTITRHNKTINSYRERGKQEESSESDLSDENVRAGKNFSLIRQTFVHEAIIEETEENNVASSSSSRLSTKVSMEKPSFSGNFPNDEFELKPLKNIKLNKVAPQPQSEDKPSSSFTGLDVPRQSTQNYSFPSIINVTKFVSDLSKEVNLNKLCHGTSSAFAETPTMRIFMDTPESTGSHSFSQVARNLLNASSRIKKENSTDNASIEVETMASLSDMCQCRRKQSVDMGFYDVDSTSPPKVREKDSTDSEDDSSGCNCFKMCFLRKRKKYFS